MAHCTQGMLAVIAAVLMGVLGRPKQCSLSVAPDDGFAHVLPGSDVSFVCSATCLGALSRDQLIWKDPSGKRVPVVGGKRVQAVSYNRWAVSRLVVSAARPADSGVYTCQIQHQHRLLQYTALLQVQDTRLDDPGPRRGDIFIQPEPDLGPIRPVRSAPAPLPPSPHGNHTVTWPVKHHDHDGESESELGKENSESESELGKENSESESELGKENSESKSELGKENSESESELEKENSESESELEKENSESESELGKENSESESELGKENSESESELGKENSESESELGKENSESESELEKENSESESELGKENSESESELGKENSESESELGKENSESESELGKENSESESELGKENSESESELGKENSESESELGKENSESESELGKENSESESELGKENSESESELGKENSESESELGKENSESESELGKENSESESELGKENSEEDDQAVGRVRREVPNSTYPTTPVDSNNGTVDNNSTVTEAADTTQPNTSQADKTTPTKPTMISTKDKSTNPASTTPFRSTSTPSATLTSTPSATHSTTLTATPSATLTSTPSATPSIILTATPTPTSATSVTGAKADNDAAEDDDIRNAKAASTQDGGGEGESDFGRYGKLAFGLAMGAVVLLLYVLALVILLPRCRKRSQSLTLNTPSRHVTNGKESDVILMGERPHNPLAPMTSATGLNGEYITAVDLDNNAGGDGEMEGEREEGDKDAARKEEDEETKGQESFVSSFLIGRLSSSKPTDADTPPDVSTARADDDNVFVSSPGNDGQTTPDDAGEKQTTTDVTADTKDGTTLTPPVEESDSNGCNSLAIGSGSDGMLLSDLQMSEEGEGCVSSKPTDV